MTPFPTPRNHAEEIANARAERDADAVWHDITPDPARAAAKAERRAKALPPLPRDPADVARMAQNFERMNDAREPPRWLVGVALGLIAGMLLVIVLALFAPKVEAAITMDRAECPTERC